MPIYRMIIEGTGVKVPCTPDPIIGFYTTRTASGANQSKAEAKGKELVIREWRASGFSAENIGNAPKLEVESIREISLFSALFSRAPKKGFSFYSHE